MENKILSEEQLKMVLTVAVDIGESMLKSGAEVRRVEDTITRICRAYGCTDSDVFTITSEIIATGEYNHTSHTLTRRIRYYAYNLKQLEELNELSRSICANTPDPASIPDRIQDIVQRSVLDPVKKLVGYLVGGFFFTLFFGGSFLDAIVALFISLAIFTIDYFFKRGRINMLAYSVTASALAGLAAMGLNHIIPNLDLNKVIIGNVMLLIPGVGLTNGARDLLGGDIVSGIWRLSEAILVSIAVATGFAIPFLLFGGIA